MARRSSGPFPSTNFQRNPTYCNLFIDFTSRKEPFALFEAARQNLCYTYLDHITAAEDVFNVKAGSVFMFEARSGMTDGAGEKGRWTDHHIWNKAKKDKQTSTVYYKEMEEVDLRSADGQWQRVRFPKHNGLRKWTVSAWVVIDIARPETRAFRRLVWYTTDDYSERGAATPNLRISAHPILSSIQVPPNVYFNGPADDAKAVDMMPRRSAVAIVSHVVPGAPASQMFSASASAYNLSSTPSLNSYAAYSLHMPSCAHRPLLSTGSSSACASLHDCQSYDCLVGLPSINALASGSSYANTCACRPLEDCAGTVLPSFKAFTDGLRYIYGHN